MFFSIVSEFRYYWKFFGSNIKTLKANFVGQTALEV